MVQPMWICLECRTLYRTALTECERDGEPVIEVRAHQNKSRYPLLGKLVDDRYHLIGGLGQGGLGTVYLAQHTRLEQLFAVKFLDLQTVGIDCSKEQKDEYRKDFMKEARVASLIRHESVVRVIDYGQFEGMPFLVMEFVPGPSLLQMLTENGRFATSDALSIARRIAEALTAFHERQLVHRDLKPANVILDPRGDGRLTLVDLGLVKDISGQWGKASTHPMALRGTPGYLSPEQVPPWVLSTAGQLSPRAKSVVDGRADIYALGVILYEMLAGVSPYPDGTNTQIIVFACTKDPLPLNGVEPPLKLIPGLEALVYRAMARDPDQRPAGASEFIEQLNEVVLAPAMKGTWPVVGAPGVRTANISKIPPALTAHKPRRGRSAEASKDSRKELEESDFATMVSDKTAAVDADEDNHRFAQIAQFDATKEFTADGSLDSFNQLLEKAELGVEAGFDSLDASAVTALDISSGSESTFDEGASALGTAGGRKTRVSTSPVPNALPIMPGRQSESNRRESNRSPTSVSNVTEAWATNESPSLSGGLLWILLALVAVSAGVLAWTVSSENEVAVADEATEEVKASAVTKVSPASTDKKTSETIQPIDKSNTSTEENPFAQVQAQPIFERKEKDAGENPRPSRPIKATRRENTKRKRSPAQPSVRKPRTVTGTVQPAAEIDLNGLYKQAQRAIIREDYSTALQHYSKWLSKAGSNHPNYEAVKTRIAFCKDQLRQREGRKD